MLPIAPISIDLYPTNKMMSDSCNDESIVTIFSPIEIISGKITPEPQQSSQQSQIELSFSNYDVLLMPIEADNNSPVVRFAPGNHVGNQRFRVLLSLFRARYLQANKRGDKEDCTRIAQEVMDTVYHKCVPHGRFYEQGRDNSWQEIQLGKSLLAIIKSSLKNEPKDGLHLLGRRPKRVCRRSSAFDGSDVYRRSSAFGSVVSTDSDEHQNHAISSPNRFDVICEPDGLRLKKDCQHTGNNRLKVMLDMRKTNYKKSNPARKDRIVREVVCSIMDDTSSQFLASHESSSKTYKPISRELAAACIKNSLLDNNNNTTTSADNGEKRKFRKSEVKKLMDRRKKKALLGSLERRKGNSCKLPTSSMSPPTTFKAFEPVPLCTPVAFFGQHAAI